MPIHKGYEIKNFLNPIPCPIIFTSAYSRDKFMFKGLEDAIFINKPINMIELKNAIDWAILIRKTKS